ILLSSSALAEGTHNFYVKQTDLAGNSSCSPATVSYVKDAIPPANPTINGALGGLDVTADSSLTSGNVVTVSWQDLSDEYEYQVSIWDAGDSSNICPEVTLAMDQTAYTFSDCPLDAGTGYTVRLSATDLAGNPSG